MGISNRRLFAAHLLRIRRQAQRDRCAVALVLIEIAHFAELETRAGRDSAAAAVRLVATTVMRGARRPLDCAARLGGANFVIVLYDVERRYVERLAADLRDEVASLEIPNPGAPYGMVAVRIGAAFSAAAACDSKVLRGIAEQALAAAKADGGDGVVVRNVLAREGATVATGPWRARER